MQTNCLALDLATKTGYAHTSGLSGVVDFGFTPDEQLGVRVYKPYRWLTRIWIKQPIDCLVYEQAHQRGGPSTRSALMLIAAVEFWAFENMVPVYTYHTATIKKHATGKGRADKAAVVAAAQEQWPDVEIKDDNHADALWLLDLHLSRMQADLDE